MATGKHNHIWEFISHGYWKCRICLRWKRG